MSKKSASGITEKMLRDQGFFQGPDGSWSKGAPPAKPVEKHKAEKPVPTSEPHQKFLILATIITVRPRDYDGLSASIKSIIDRLVELRRIPVPDDSPDYIETVSLWRKCAHFAQQKTVIEVFKLTEQTS